jgi:hypothetical protein
MEIGGHMKLDLKGLDFKDLSWIELALARYLTCFYISTFGPFHYIFRKFLE